VKTGRPRLVSTNTRRPISPNVRQQFAVPEGVLADFGDGIDIEPSAARIHGRDAAERSKLDGQPRKFARAIASAESGIEGVSMADDQKTSDWTTVSFASLFQDARLRSLP
jgi:hypothetical protein